jgi:hypothetical protein
VFISSRDDAASGGSKVALSLKGSLVNDSYHPYYTPPSRSLHGRTEEEEEE